MNAENNQNNEKRVNIAIAFDVYKKLKEYADKKAIKPGTLIRMIIIEWLEKNQ